MVDAYARKLAENLNAGNRIDARCPSILVAGGSNFPVRKKEKQNAARDRNMEEWRRIQQILDKCPLPAKIDRKKVKKTE